MNVVTGGTGFLGAHVVRALLRRGEPVRCLVREASPRRNLDGLSVELAVGDLNDPGSLARAFRGATVLYHCAADYRLFARNPREIFRTNVAGTENVLRAAAEAGVARVVHTSSVGTLGRGRGAQPADETTPVSRREMIGAYKASKFDAERVAEEWARRGLPVVIVNPSTPVGELDAKPTPTGRILVDFLNCRMPAYVDTGLNLIDARDAAEGHLLAAERGRAGEKYILGNRNMTLKEIFDSLSSFSGIPSPRVRLPSWVPIAVGALDTAVARLSYREPRVSLDSARMSRHRMYFDPGKAVRELGLPQSSVEAALERAVKWFRDNGFVRG
ncbi:MAG: hopanoid-associated sugar epimerase [Thermoanaerobaculia bacterium]